MAETAWHEPVLVKEVLQTLAPAPGRLIVDANLGQGGHSLEILSRLGDAESPEGSPEGLLVGMDRDSQMLEAARRRFDAAHIPRSRYHLIQGDHAELPQLLSVALAESSRSRAHVDADAPDAPSPFAAPDAVLFDLGPSTPQILDPRRGMSWTSEEAFDMRMNPQEAVPTATDIVNTWDADALARLFHEHGDERWAKRIARRLVEQRREGPIRTARQFAEIVAGAIPRKAWPPKCHPATRCLMSLRVEVNHEFESLERALPAAFEALKPGGRLVVIAFHSGEDRRVKRFMREVTTPPETPWPLPQGDTPARARWLVRKPLRPSEEEVARNPASRSSRLRAVQKLEAGV